MAKARHDYTIGDMIRLKGGFYKTKYYLNKFSDDEYRQIIDSLRFLNIYTRDYPEIRTYKYTELLNVDRDPLQPLKTRPEIMAKIGPIIVQLEEQYTSVIEEQKARIDDSVDKINEYYAREYLSGIDDEINRLVDRRKGYEHDLTYYIDEAAEKTKLIANTNKILEDYEEKRYQRENNSSEDPFINELHSIVSTGNWLYLGINTNGYHQFVTAERVVCSHVNPSANINMSVDFGYFRVCIQPHKKQYRVWPFADALSGVGNTPHPHISSGGSICWGNVSERVQELVGYGDWNQVLTVLLELLTTYSPNNPYRSLTSYRNDLSRRGRVLNTRSDIEYAVNYKTRITVPEEVMAYVGYPMEEIIVSTEPEVEVTPVESEELFAENNFSEEL